MRYIGGKHAIRREVASLIAAECGRLGHRTVWEPFCGGLHVTAELGRRGYNVHASDLSKPAITLYRAISLGWRPPEHVSEAQWKMLKLAAQEGEVNPLIAYAGYACSFNGVYFASYDGRGRPSAIVQRVKAAQFASLTYSPYSDVRPPPAAVIYCDPPYAGTDAHAYRALPADERKFDHEAFWAWCRERQEEGCTVLVSEYTAPDDIPCVWQVATKVHVASHAGEVHAAVERVYRLQGEP